MHTIFTLAMALTVSMLAAAPGQSFSGVLESSDPVWEDSRHYDAYTVEVEQNQQVTVSMESAEFDTYLIVRGPDGTTFTNDDFEGTNSSQVQFLALAGGKWTIMASAFGTEAGGSYSVEVTLGAVGEVEVIDGRLDPSDAQALKGEYYDAHVVEIGDERPFTVELISYGFDGYLVVQAAGGETWRNDDTDSMNVSRVGPLSGAGTWTVTVTTSSPEQMGAYDLRIIRFP